MKRGIAVIWIVLLMMILTACGNSAGDGQEGIYKKFHAMENYRAEAEVTVYGNKENSTYIMRQYYAEPDKFRCEVLDEDGAVETVCVTNGGKTRVQSADFGGNTLENSERPMDYMSLADFFSHYFMDGDAAAETSAGQEDILLKLGESDGRYRFCQNLWIDKQSLMPRRLVTFDRDGGETLSVTYRTFEINHKNFTADFSVE